MERSLSEIKSNTESSPNRSGKAISIGETNKIVPTSTTQRTTPTTTQRTTTTTTPRTTTARRRPSTTRNTTPSIEDDIRQFEEDSKLLQALLKATGQDPSKFNIPTITNPNANIRVSPSTTATDVNDELKLLSNLLATPSPLNEPFDSLTKNPIFTTNSQTTTIPANDIKNLQDDPKFLQSLIQLQGGQETTTQKIKLVNSGMIKIIRIYIIIYIDIHILIVIKNELICGGWGDSPKK